MSQQIIELVGYLAATLTTLSFFPQTIKTIKTQHTKDLSLGMYTAFTIGIFLWLFYGILIKSSPIIIANALTIVLTSIILYMKIKNG